MSRLALVAGLALVGGAVWWVSRQDQTEIAQAADDAAQTMNQTVDDVLGSVSDVVESVAETFDSVTGGMLKISAMAQVTPDLLTNRNVQAMLRVIRRGEGTADAGGYQRLFGGGTFDSLADHPRQVIKKSGYTSSAAGAYQILSSTWDETKRIMKLPDFSPRSQDLAAIGRIKARGALDDVLAGRFTKAVNKIAREWASLPGSPYGQPTISWSTAMAEFTNAGGTSSGTAMV
ncbi:glycoside hydrolase family 24 protein [Lacisediminimonas profundi]|uniref:glycoside hydrolase family 24 protein n=1 Tax=Lacisediminimonas profundi TaxID=2603856 RepID=UPI00124B4EFE|nr:glycoside hydrolase family 104 protein [Lacisediminimonas profundi]